MDRRILLLINAVIITNNPKDVLLLSVEQMILAGLYWLHTAHIPAFWQ